MPVENIGKAPVLVDVSVQGDQLTLTYDEPLDETSVPTTGSFTVMVDGANRAVSTVKINGEKVTLTLESAVAPGEEVTLSYTPGSPRIVDLTEIPAGPINNLKLNNSTPKVDDNRAQGTNDWLTRFGAYGGESDGGDDREPPQIAFHEAGVAGDPRRTGRELL